MYRKEINKLLNTLTLEEKASLCSGADFWQTKSIPNKGIPSIWMSDGPHGLRKADEKHIKENGGRSVKATCFPTESTLACSWDRALIEKIGSAIAEECLCNEVSVLLGPGVNIKRSPLCGRNFEYYSEDPFLTGKLATSMINGIQQKGVGACIKHFAANNQEHKRMSISSEIDERALHEIYLRAFRMAITHANPATVMCSYNKVNNIYSSENKELLCDILRDKWGFNGLVMSDWSAVSNRVDGIKAGLDLEMPSSGTLNDKKIINAVNSGELSLEALDKAVYRVLCIAIDGNAHKNSSYSFNQAEHHMLAIEAALHSAVLLKNDGILPLCPVDDICVIGAMAKHPRIQGSGSSIINTFETESFLKAQGLNCPYAKGYSTDIDSVDRKLTDEAIALAKEHNKVIYFIGLTDIYESEGYDRTDLSLPINQVDLLDKLYAVNKNIVIVLSTGSPIEMPWLHKVSAVLYTALGGEGVGEATRRLLYGEVCPSGKLAETWPNELCDVPCAQHYPMGPSYVSYNESIYVGYRYYDKANKNVLFPFGYGLSYAHFNYEALSLSHSVLPKNAMLIVTFIVTNTSEFDGCEISEVYISHKNSTAYQCVKTLAGFARNKILMNTTQAVNVCIPYSAFSFYNVETHDYVVETGEYEILCGSDSRHLPLHCSIKVNGETVSISKNYSANGPYGKVTDNTFSDDDFSAIHICKSSSNKPKVKGEYTLSTTLDEMTDSLMARIIAKVALEISKHSMYFSTNSRVNSRVCSESIKNLPFKNLALNSSGIISHEISSILLDICNGKRKYWALVKAIIFRNSCK